MVFLNILKIKNDEINIKSFNNYFLSLNDTLLQNQIEVFKAYENFIENFLEDLI